MKRNCFKLKFQNKKTILALLCLRGRQSICVHNMNSDRLGIIIL